jgi:hypothetical protein
VAMATSAAPTYFPLAELDSAQYVDGGLVPFHRDDDGLFYRKIGRASGGTRSWMLRAAPGPV